MIKIRFKCGHEGQAGITGDTAPRCHCGETEIVRTFARAPRFTGAVSGPYAETKSVDPGVVRLTETPLVLKEN